MVVILSLCGAAAYAGRVSGLVRDDKGNPLGYASLTVKGTTRGVTAGGNGKYSMPAKKKRSR